MDKYLIQLYFKYTICDLFKTNNTLSIYYIGEIYSYSLNWRNIKIPFILSLLYYTHTAMLWASVRSARATQTAEKTRKGFYWFTDLFQNIKGDSQ